MGVGVYRSLVCGMVSGASGLDLREHPPAIQRYETADAWLQAAVVQLNPVFENQGFTLPSVRVHLGWTSVGRRGSRVGECWPSNAVEDGMNAIFITTQMKSPVDVLDVLVHELVHAVDDCTHKHGKEFAHIAKKVGLAGPPWRSAGAGSVLLEELKAISNNLGHLPYSPIAEPVSQGREMKSGRVICPKCGYTCRTLSEWNPQGAPLCPQHRERLVEDWRLAENHADYDE